MPLRRLTKFSRIELEKEQEELRARRSRSSTRSSPTTKLLRKVVSDELAEVAKTYGTPRRTVLLESAGTAVTAAAVPLEVADDPCFAYLSSSGLLARTSSDEPPGEGGARTNHDVVVSAVRTTARGEVGVLTSRGRLRQARRARPAGAARRRQRPQPPGRAPAQRGAAARRRRARARADLAGHRRARPRARHPPGRRQAGQPRGPRQGRVGRHLAQGRRRGGRRRRAAPPATRRSASSPPTPSCCTSAPTRSARRAAPAAASPASGSPAGERRSGSARVDPTASVVVTASGSSTALPGTEPGAVKVTPFSRVPRQGPRPPAACAATASSRARTPWSSPGPAPPRRGPRRPAARPSTCPRRPAGGTAPACPAASRSRPAPARSRARLAAAAGVEG